MLIAALRILAATLGAAGGIIGGMFGVGGGVIVIPLLGMLYDLDQQVAQGTTLVMVVPNVMLGFWRYRQRVGLDPRIALTLAVSALAATYPVARIATGLDPHNLRLAFAGFLVILGAIVAYVTWRGFAGSSGRAPLAWGWSAILGVAGGVVSGRCGVGGDALGGLRLAQADVLQHGSGKKKILLGDDADMFMQGATGDVTNFAAVNQ